MDLAIREAQKADLEPLIELYMQLHGNRVPEFDERLELLWSGIIADRNHHIIVGTVDGRLVSSCALVVIPNLTHGQRPYALIENVITHADYRKRGFATRLLRYARDLAELENCYKIMLMTGSKKESTLRFYERCGYNMNDKTAFIKWL